MKVIHANSPFLSRAPGRFTPRQRPGYVLIAVLVVIVVLTLAAYRYSDMMMAEYRATDRILKNAEVKALADSGIHYTAAILADPNGMSNLAYNPYNNSAFFQSKLVDLGNDRKGYFTIITPAYAQASQAGSLPYYYGVVDEGSKLNINALVALDPSAGGIAYTALMTLPNMTDDIAYSIIDWIDADDTVSPGGAEDDYYMGLSNPYHCKNAPLDSIEELLLVKGITAYLLFGDDLNRNGQQDPEESASAGQFSLGWAPYLTMYSRESNVDSSGNPRININGKNLQTILSSLQAIDNSLAGYVVAYRMYGPYTATANAKVTAGSSDQLFQVVSQAVSGGQANSKQNVSSVWELIGTSVAITGQDGTMTVYPSPLTSGSDLLSKALDQLTTKSNTTIYGRVNVNTASPTILAALPGLTQADVTAIVANQPDPTTADATSYQTTAWLYSSAQITPAKLQALESYITTRSQVYRIQSIGYLEKSGPMARVEAVVDTNNGFPRFLYYRDLTELGRGIDPRNSQ